MYIHMYTHAGTPQMKQTQNTHLEKQFHLEKKQMHVNNTNLLWGGKIQQLTINVCDFWKSPKSDTSIKQIKSDQTMYLNDVTPY